MICTQCGGPMIAREGQMFSFTKPLKLNNATGYWESDDEASSTWCGDCIDSFNELVPAFHEKFPESKEI